MAPQDNPRPQRPGGRAARRLKRQRERQDIRAAIRVARAQGCTCTPFVKVASPLYGIPRVEVVHPPECVLMRAQEGPDPYARSRQIVAYRPEAI